VDGISSKDSVDIAIVQGLCVKFTSSCRHPDSVVVDSLLRIAAILQRHGLFSCAFSLPIHVSEAFCLLRSYFRLSFHSSEENYITLVYGMKRIDIADILN
jgi:hypothetical protein